MPDDPTSSPLAAPPATAALAPRLGLATFRSLRHRNYRLYFFGQMVSLTGSWMQTTALMTLVYGLTGQSWWTGLIQAAQLLPTFLLGAWGGSLADRWPRRGLLVATQAALLVLALMLMAVVLGRRPEPWELLAITAAAGVVQGVDLPTRLTFVSDMVSREDVVNAVALNSVLFNSARVLGPLLGVSLLLRFGPEVCFLGNALSYAAVIVALLCMNVPPAREAPPEHGGLRSLLAGFATVAGRPPLLFLILAAGVTSLCGWPFLSLLPALADRRFGDAKAYGLMLSGTGLGALSAALAVATFGSWERRKRFLAAGVAVLCAGLVGLALATGLPAAGASCFLAGFGLVMFFSTGQSVVQLSAAAHNRGRLLGIWAMVLSGSAPLGCLAVGRAADVWGVTVVLLVQGLACCGTSLVLVVLYQRWRWEPERAEEGG